MKTLKRAVEDVESEDFLKRQRLGTGKRKFHFKDHPKRKIAIQFLYYGWEHDGLVQQLSTTNTVEHHLMIAAEKTHLIENWKTCDFSRCGRTDKGVSAFKQTAAFIVRSARPNDNHVFWESDADPSVISSYPEKHELNYVKMLNAILPKSIRVFAWASVPQDFSARFRCNQRTYKYAFPKTNINSERLKTGAAKLVGEHNFSNFCMIDMNKLRLEQSYVRSIYDIQVEEIKRNESNSGMMIEITVVGSGFLWHMIRFIVSVLYEIGRENESPELIDELLDVSKNPSRPQYGMAVDTPLCLFECRYESADVKWIVDEDTVIKTVFHLQKTWAAFQTRARMLENMISNLSTYSDRVDLNKGLDEFTMGRPIPSKYVKIMDRATCLSLEERRGRFEEKEKAKQAQ